MKNLDLNNLKSKVKAFHLGLGDHNLGQILYLTL